MNIRRIAWRIATGLSVPKIIQKSCMCGPASLSAVLSYYGVEKTQDELRELSGTDFEDLQKFGVLPEDLVKAAESAGLQVTLTEDATLEDLQEYLQRGIPVIVDWFSEDDGHYSVVTALRDGQVFMMDPEFGAERAIPFDEFERIWFDFDGDTEQHEGLVSRLIIVAYPKSALPTGFEPVLTA